MRIAFLAELVVLIILGVGHPASAHQFEIGDIKIIHPVSRPTMGAAANSAVYLTIRNGGAADVLVDVVGPDADKVQLHASVIEGDVMTMQHLEEGLEIPARSEIRLMPGGNHIMLIGLAEPLNVYDTFKLTLVFEKAGAIEIEVYVVDPTELEVDVDHEMDHDMDAD